MTDYVLRSADQATMYAAFTADGIYVDGVLKTQGILSDGGAWCLVDQGLRWYPTGNTIDTPKGPMPEMASDEYWVPLRWNSGEPTPASQPGVTIAWQSDAEPSTEYPEGVTRFA
jgi:hypothetical protein